MTDKCRRAKGATLELCDAAQLAVDKGMVHLQTMRCFETDKRRERLAIGSKKQWAPLYYCPWCRADIDTRPRVRAAQAKQGGKQP